MDASNLITASHEPDDEPRQQAPISDGAMHQGVYPTPTQAVSLETSIDRHPSITLTPHEILQLRRLLNNHSQTQPSVNLKPSSSFHSTGADSEYSEFPQTTHAWAVYSGNPGRKATIIDRTVGTFIMVFQMFTYYLFASEALEDYSRGAVKVLVSHRTCQQSGEEPVEDFICEADETSHFDAFAAFVMLSVFLTPEILGALRAVRNAYQNPDVGNITLVFAVLATVEVISAFLAAAIAISYQLYIGEVTDAIEAGVGLLFVRELSSRAYSGIRHKGVKQYRSFILMLVSLVIVGFALEAACEAYATRVLHE